ncbi:MAG: triose-phosphate isomerase [Ferruginibacter sp.]
MRQKIAAANWKMNLTLTEAMDLTHALLPATESLLEHQQVLLAVPFPYLIPVRDALHHHTAIQVCAQNVAATKNGAYTGEVSASMLSGLGVSFAIVGHSERRLYYHETPDILAQKVDRLLEELITPVFCCGEPLDIREAGTQNAMVESQLRDSLFHLSADALQKIIIAYEPIWAIGTGKTASSDQAQEMHAHIRGVIAKTYGVAIANDLSILYGGSVKASNATELFGKSDVDGGLVGGASLQATEFVSIISQLA